MLQASKGKSFKNTVMYMYSTLHVSHTNSEHAFCCGFLLLQVEDDSCGEQDALSACILQSLQKLAQRSVAFAKATPPQANRDRVSLSACIKMC